MGPIRMHGRRFAWLMAGAAIGLAVIAVVAVAMAYSPLTAPLVPAVVACLLAAAGLGLVPGVRELEVTGARSMLGSTSELITPRRLRATHRLRSAAWVMLHLLAGVLVAAGLTMVGPAAIVAVGEAISGRELSLTSGLGLPTTMPGRIAQTVLATVVAVVGVGLWWPLGALASRSVRWFLGPTDHDRLELVTARAEREAERGRIARDLHDGIGHALTIISVQSAAGRRVLEKDPDAAGRSLRSIEDTAHEALEELDAMLAVLRQEERGRGTRIPPAGGHPGSDPADDPVGGAPPAATARLDRMVADQRRTGMDLDARIDLPEGIAALQQRHLERIVTELLTNARRHGGPGRVRLEVASADGTITVDARNPLPEGGTRAVPSAPATTGPRAIPGPQPDAGGHDGADGGRRGLVGLAERLALFDGTLEVGARDGVWHARAQLPILREDAR